MKKLLARTSFGLAGGFVVASTGSASGALAEPVEAKKLHQHVTALCCWLGLWETLAAQAELRGLSWGAGRYGLGLSVALVLGKRPGWRPLAAMLPISLGVQLGLAMWRRRDLNPLQQLAPGVYRDRSITRLDLAAQAGPVPALHIVPTGGTQAAVCVVHGSGGDKCFYAWRLVEVLVQHGFAVLLIDLDGHGESPRAQAFPSIVTSVAGPLAWLQAHYGWIGLLGMSLGGAVATRAIAEGAHCDALVLWVTPPRLRLSRAAYRRVQLLEALRIIRLPLVHLFRDAAPQHIVAAWQTSGIRAQIGTWDLFDALDLLGSLAQIKARAPRPPLLLYYAGRDAVVAPSSAEAVRTATADWSEFRRIPGASHVSLPIEQAVIEGTVAWLGCARELGSLAAMNVAPTPHQSNHTQSPEQARDRHHG
ncbi:alpha/beta hydrolase [Candidatus Viridilinea mediisalina]|uniref:alpha/beta hydrolase n=1 Tax=Candidatus Viridilinea mediisalina TaxID=2024553 RepID=UPI001FE9168F|nr:alpha/beta fold hydrolase [Candidatus Viridilinea mediisalina]